MISRNPYVYLQGLVALLVMAFVYILAAGHQHRQSPPDLFTSDYSFWTSDYSFFGDDE